VVSILLPSNVTLTEELSSYPTSKSLAVNSALIAIVEVVDKVATKVSALADDDVAAEEDALAVDAVVEEDEVAVDGVWLLPPELQPVSNIATTIIIDNKFLYPFLIIVSIPSHYSDISNMLLLFDILTI
jgi:hypothetical protein